MNTPVQHTTTGLWRFVVIWLTQMVSLVGSSVTGFALGVWTYQETGSVMQFGWVLLAGNLPAALLSPFAGVLIDRFPRKRILLICDLGAALGIVSFFPLLGDGQPSAWHIYLFNAYLSALSAFHWPAYCAGITLMVPKRLLGNINGMVQFSKAVGQIGSPLLAGILITLIDLRGVLLLDGFTFLIAFIGLLCIRIPEPPIAADDPHTAPSASKSKLMALLRDAHTGWRYLIERPGLAWLLALSATSNLLLGMVEVLVIPLALALTSPVVLGTLMTIGGVGMLAGGLTLSIWGGPKRKVWGVLGFDMLTGLCTMCFGIFLDLNILGVVIFVFFFSLPLTNGCAQAILQQKVALRLQGRVFAIGSAAVVGALPLAYVIAGPLVEHLFDPFMRGDSAAIPVIEAVIGHAPEQGTRVLLVIVGAIAVVKSLFAAWQKPLMRAETALPDAHDSR